MKVLFAQNLVYVPGYGGASKASRAWAERLAAHGHDCHAVTPLDGLMRGSAEHPADLVARLGVTEPYRDEEALTYRLGGVRVHAVTSASRLAARIRTVAARVEPDWVVVPSDDPAGLVLGTALACAPGRVVHVTYTIQQLLCGPGVFYPSAARTELLRRAAGAVAISEAARDHLRDWAGVAAEVCYPPLYRPAPQRLSRWNEGSVTMVNPCGYKGLPIFRALARAFPTVPFLAVPTWGTTAEDRTVLAGQSNMELAEPADDIDDVLRRTRILLVPSLWDETFGFVCVEAMQRGIPVLASDVAGLREAKLGVPYSLPVRRIESYDADADPARPVPVLPAQDLGPWRAALGRLLADRAHFEDVSDRSAEAAAAFVSSVDERAFERYLSTLAGAR